jgi:hypothetical protein
VSGSDGLLDILTEAFPSATADQIESAGWRLMARADTQRAEAEKRGAAELQRRIDVVLAWHNPVESEYRDTDGNVTRTITECAHCSTLADDGVDWPCATARALGAQSGEVTLP